MIIDHIYFYYFGGDASDNANFVSFIRVSLKLEYASSIPTYGCLDFDNGTRKTTQLI